MANIDFSEILSFNQEPIERKIRFQPDEGFVDSPDTLRWRAWWEKLFDGEVIGISLQCYPVVRLTPCGAWIDPFAYRQWGQNGQEWVAPIDDKLLRWVGNDSGQAWAKPTQQAAIDSLIYRYGRWTKRIFNDVEYYIRCGKVLAEMMPDKASIATDGANWMAQYLASQK